MDLLVVGGGGREHALIRSLKQDTQIDKIYALPGNGGIALDAECIDISATDIPKIVQFAKDHQVDFAVVAPDDPLVLGAVDALEAAGIPAFGPNAAAAHIEGSKAFSKNLMRQYNIPTADYEVFDNKDAAIRYLQRPEQKFPVVIKADGLALGKGVIIADNITQAQQAVKSMMEDHTFGDAGNQVVIEEFLTGPEVTVLAFTDGYTVVPMLSSMDHKRVFDNDLGLNTGGMGVIAPNPYYTDQVAQQCWEKIYEPTIAAMRAEGRPFKGCLYFGLMLTEEGPKVIEYNCRFGDPEAQAVLPLLRTDLLTIFKAVRDEKLSQLSIEFDQGSSCCVVLASGGYPQKYEKNKPIHIAEDFPVDATIFHAGTALKEVEQGESVALSFENRNDLSPVLVTNGGRVLAVTATAEDLPSAIKKAYEAADKVTFEGAHRRQDIGQIALRALDQSDTAEGK